MKRSHSSKPRVSAEVHLRAASLSFYFIPLASDCRLSAWSGSNNCKEQLWPSTPGRVSPGNSLGSHWKRKSRRRKKLQSLLKYCFYTLLKHFAQRSNCLWQKKKTSTWKPCRTQLLSIQFPQICASCPPLANAPIRFFHHHHSQVGSLRQMVTIFWLRDVRTSTATSLFAVSVCCSSADVLHMKPVSVQEEATTRWLQIPSWTTTKQYKVMSDQSNAISDTLCHF